VPFASDRIIRLNEDNNSHAKAAYTVVFFILLVS